MTHSITPFIHRKIVVLKEDSTAFQAAKAMCDNQIGCVVVSDSDGHMSGILTDRDVTCRLVAKSLSPDTPLREILTSQLIWVGESALVGEVVQLMDKFGIRRIPVVHQGSGGRQRCVGIVTLDDIIASEVLSTESFSRVIRSQIRAHHRSIISPKKTITDSVTKEFIDTLARKTEINAEQARTLAKFVFSGIVRRLHYTSAVQFILQTPGGFHEELFNLKSGPDRSIDAQYFTVGTAAHLHMKSSDAKDALKKFWTVLLQFTSKASIEHTSSHLPEEIRELFSSEPPPGIFKTPIDLGISQSYLSDSKRRSVKTGISQNRS